MLRKPASTPDCARCRFVAAPAATPGLLLELVGGPEQKPRCSSSRRMTWPLVRDSSHLDHLVLTAPSSRKEKRPWLAYVSSTARPPSPGTDERGRQKYCIAGGKGLRHSLSQRIRVKISLSGNTRADDARCEGAHEASDPEGAVGIVRAQVRLHAKGPHVDGTCSAKEQRQSRSDHRICPGGPERFVDPIADRRDELHGCSALMEPPSKSIARTWPPGRRAAM